MRRPAIPLASRRGRAPARLGTCLLAAALAGCAAAVPVPAPVRSPAAAGSGPAAPEVRELVARVNRFRRERGLGALQWDERVAAVAQAHSEDMARRGFFDHHNPDGASPFDRLERAGVVYRAAAENIAEGPAGAAEVLDGWLGSPGHRRNLANPVYTHHGIGLHRNFWTHVLIRPP